MKLGIMFMYTYIITVTQSKNLWIKRWDWNKIAYNNGDWIIFLIFTNIKDHMF